MAYIQPGRALYGPSPIDTDTDEKVAVDSSATAGYLGSTDTDGVLRIAEGSLITYTDGGDFVTLNIDEETLDGIIASSYLRLDGSNANQNIDIGIYDLDATDVRVSGSISDSTLNISGGSITSAVNGTFSGTVQAEQITSTDDIDVQGGVINMGDSMTHVPARLNFLDPTNAGYMQWDYDNTQVIFRDDEENKAGIDAGVVNFISGQVDTSLVVGTIVTDDWNAFDDTSLDMSKGVDTTFTITNSGLGDGYLAIDVLTASQGVYTDASKRLVSTPPTSGTLGYWDRTGTNLSPANAGDNISMPSGTITAGTFNTSGLALSGTLIAAGSSSIQISANTYINLTSSSALVRPNDNGVTDFGDGTHYWKDIYASGVVYTPAVTSVGGMTISNSTSGNIDINNTGGSINLSASGANINLNTSSGGDVVFNPSSFIFRPIGDNTIDFGKTDKRIKDIFIGGNLSDGTNALTVANAKTAYDHSQVTHDYAYITGNDGATNVTAAELEELSDGSETALHIHDARYFTETELGSNSNALGASLIGIEDSATQFTATEVEAALAEVMDKITPITYTANSITTVTGTLDSGDVNSIITIDDGDSYDVSEVTGAPGFDIQVTYTGIATGKEPTEILLHVGYDGSAGHNIDVEMWNYTGTPAWDKIDTDVFPDTGGGFASYTISITGNITDYVSGGEAKLRFNHTSAGNITHNILIDYAALKHNTSSGGGVTEHGALSGLQDDDHLIYLLTDGSRTLTGAWDMGSQALTNVNIDSGDINVAVTNTEWDAAYSHVSNNGSDHSYIDQDVTTTGTPTFDDLILTDDLTVGTDVFAVDTGDATVKANGREVVTVFDTNQTLYVATGGSDVTGTGEVGTPFATINGALTYLADKRFPAVTVTITCGDGVYTLSAQIAPTHPDLPNLVIQGTNQHDITMSSVQSSSGSSQAWAVILNVSDVSNVAVGDYVIVYDTASGTLPEYLNGCHEVTNVDAANTRITVTVTTNPASISSGAVTGSISVLKAIMDWNGSANHGIRMTSSSGRLIVKNLALVNSATNRSGINISNGAAVYLQDVGTSGWQYGIYMANGAGLTGAEPVALSTADDDGLRMLTGSMAVINSLIVSGSGMDGSGIGANLTQGSKLVSFGFRSIGNDGDGLVLDTASIADVYNSTTIISGNNGDGLQASANSTFRIRGNVNNNGGYAYNALTSTSGYTTSISQTGNGSGETNVTVNNLETDGTYVQQ